MGPPVFPPARIFFFLLASTYPFLLPCSRFMFKPFQPRPASGAITPLVAHSSPCFLRLSRFGPLSFFSCPFLGSVIGAPHFFDNDGLPAPPSVTRFESLITRSSQAPVHGSISKTTLSLDALHSLSQGIHSYLSPPIM